YNSKFGHSHSQFLGTIADTLVDAGHNVTSLIPIMAPSLRDGTEKSHKIYVEGDHAVHAFYEQPRVHNFFELNMFNPIFPFIMGPIMADNFGRTCALVVNEPGLIARLKAERYDLMITENFDPCGIGLSEAIGTKSVITSSSTCLVNWQHDLFGVEQALSYRMSLMSRELNVHSMVDRFWNLFAEALGRIMFYYPPKTVNRLLKETFGPEYPTIAEQSAKVAYVLTNSEPLIESAAPTSSRVINVPGMAASSPRSLDAHWEEILNRRNKTVLLSFGSMAKSVALPRQSKQGIVKAISSFPEITFIWKYEDPEDEFCTEQASKLPNLVMTKWMPQVDILNHPNLALFITHGGMASTQETALRGVPGIFVPIFGDQPRNAGMMQFNELGRVYDKFELYDGDKLAATIREVLENDKYAKNAVRISQMLARKPFESRDLLIKHVEFAAEFGASAALMPQSVKMSFVQYNNLDVLAVIVVCFGIVVAMFAKIGLYVMGLLIVKKTKSE
ncbi:hypothetical protein PFISCL1PPCAC_13442, partial [Pristionchus fissidentatus]